MEKRTFIKSLAIGAGVLALRRVYAFEPMFSADSEGESWKGSITGEPNALLARMQVLGNCMLVGGTAAALLAGRLPVRFNIAFDATDGPEQARRIAHDLKLFVEPNLRDTTVRVFGDNHEYVIMSLRQQAGAFRHSHTTVMCRNGAIDDPFNYRAALGSVAPIRTSTSLARSMLVLSDAAVDAARYKLDVSGELKDDVYGTLVKNPKSAQRPLVAALFVDRFASIACVMRTVELRQMLESPCLVKSLRALRPGPNSVDFARFLPVVPSHQSLDERVSDDVLRQILFEVGGGDPYAVIDAVKFHCLRAGLRPRNLRHLNRLAGSADANA